MHSNYFRHQALAAAVLAALPGAGACSAAQPAPGSGGGAEPAAAELTCEVSCSETELGTAVARLSWVEPVDITASTAPVAELQTTVYKGGFDRDLYAGFKVRDPSEPQAPREPEAPPELPAYDLQITRVERSDDSPAAGIGGRTTVEIEGLEPGMKYTWRVVFDTPGGQQVTETVTCEAPVCTADRADGMPNFGG